MIRNVRQMNGDRKKTHLCFYDRRLQSKEDFLKIIRLPPRSVATRPISIWRSSISSSMRLTSSSRSTTVTSSNSTLSSSSSVVLDRSWSNTDLILTRELISRYGFIHNVGNQMQMRTRLFFFVFTVVECGLNIIFLKNPFRSDIAFTFSFTLCRWALK